MDPAQQWLGQTIDGRYLVESVLGVGGMGTVLRAKQQFTGATVAIKLLRPELQLDPDLQARFLSEAKAPNAIGHRSIVQVLDAGRTPDGLLYIAMELLVGRSLRVSLQRRELSPEVQKRVMLDLLEALGHAHAKGFVHRDLKPDNVFLCGPQNDVKLLDFGIAKVFADARKTATGALLGTPAYMAPEQLANAAGVDSRADLWAIGVIVYEMMTGRLPIPGQTPNEILVALASAEPTPIRAYLPHATREVEQFFERALARDPRRRFGAAAEILQALAPLPFTAVPGGGGAISGTAATAATGYPAPVGATVGTVAPHAVPQVMQPTGAPPKSKAVWIVVAAVAVVGIGIGAVVALSGNKPEVVVVADAGPPPKPVVVPKKAKKPTTCDERCEWLQKECGTRLATCESDCKNKPDQFAECYERSESNSCRDGATCGFEKICGKPPSGKKPCVQVAQCQLKCTTENCVCGCDAQLAPAHTLELARWNACFTRAAATACAGLQGAPLLKCVGNVCQADGNACELAKL